MTFMLKPTALIILLLNNKKKKYLYLVINTSFLNTFCIIVGSVAHIMSVPSERVKSPSVKGTCMIVLTIYCTEYPVSGSKDQVHTV